MQIRRMILLCLLGVTWAHACTCSQIIQVPGKEVTGERATQVDTNALDIRADGRSSEAEPQHDSPEQTQGIEKRESPVTPENLPIEKTTPELPAPDAPGPDKPLPMGCCLKDADCQSKEYACRDQGNHVGYGNCYTKNIKPGRCWGNEDCPSDQVCYGATFNCSCLETCGTPGYTGECVPEKRTTGEPCQSDADCGGAPFQCLREGGTAPIPFPTIKGPPGGYCSKFCSHGTPKCEPGTVCFIPGDKNGACLRGCTNHIDCRQGKGYRCRPLFRGVAPLAKVCVTAHDRCALPYPLTTLLAQTRQVVLQDDLSTARDEFPKLKCGSHQVAGGGLKGGQLYYSFWGNKGDAFQIQLTPKGFHVFLYVFIKGNCSMNEIEASCSSKGKTGMMFGIINPNKTGSFQFTVPQNNTYILSVDSDGGKGPFTLVMMKK